MSPLQPQGAADPPALTAREKEVLTLIAGAYPVKKIAEKLGISPNTVQGHVTTVRAKLRLRTRAELALFAYRNGYVEPEGGTST